MPGYSTTGIIVSSNDERNDLICLIVLLVHTAKKFLLFILKPIVIFLLTGMGENTNFPKRQILPLSSSKLYPEYVPFQIRQDYQEAYSILELSPKASATLSRRCIQGMIHDKWHIVLKNLNQEISALKDKIDPTLWSAIDALRQLGNIGAHMEKDINVIVDIDSGEAHKLLALVEILIKDWYIVPHEREELLSSIVQINTDKQHERKKTE